MTDRTTLHLRDDPGGLLMRYLAGDLSSRERSALEAHVAGCARCAAEVRTLLGGGTGMVGGFLTSSLAAFDGLVTALSAAVGLGEVPHRVLAPLAPLWWSLELVAAQPALRAGVSPALVHTTALWW